MFTTKLCLATVAVALLSVSSAGGASAASSGYKAFCFAGSPTPKHICNTLKAADAAKPKTVQSARRLAAR